MIKRSEVALGVRVVFNKDYQVKCLGDKHLASDPFKYINEAKVYNDQNGDYVRIAGSSHTTSGYAYLHELDLEFNYRERVESYGLPTWKDVFNTNHKFWGDIDHASKAAERAGYKLFAWNGWVYEVNGGRTETIVELL